MGLWVELFVNWCVIFGGMVMYILVFLMMCYLYLFKNFNLGWFFFFFFLFFILFFFISGVIVGIFVLMVMFVLLFILGLVIWKKKKLYKMLKF